MKKKKNWIHNDYSYFDGVEWSPPYDITKPLYLDGKLAFYSLAEKGFQFDSSNKPWHIVTEVDLDKKTEKKKKEPLYLKEFERILSRKLHNKINMKKVA